LVYVMRSTFDASRKAIKNFVSKIKGNFWKVVKFAVAVRKSKLNLVLILWISEFNWYKCLFLVTNNKRGKLHCDFNGRIFRFLDNWRQRSPFLAFTIILIILVWILKILELYEELPQKIMSYGKMEWKYEK